jgi:hypothetical protein
MRGRDGGQCGEAVDAEPGKFADEIYLMLASSGVAYAVGRRASGGVDMACRRASSTVRRRSGIAPTEDAAACAVRRVSLSSQHIFRRSPVLIFTLLLERSVP